MLFLFVCAAILRFHPSESIVVAPNATVYFECVVQGSPIWVINGDYIGYLDTQNLQDRGYYFNDTEDGTRQTVGMAFPARIEDNSTTVSCSAGAGLKTEAVTVIIAGENQILLCS